MTRSLRLALLSGAACVFTSTAAFAACPTVTVADMQGLTPAYPQQFELAEFEGAASCELTFADHEKDPGLMKW